MRPSRRAAAWALALLFFAALLAAGGAAAADDAHAAEAAAVAAARCPAGCTAHGNCNAAQGLCDCPLGRSGPACEDYALAACVLAPGFDTACAPGQLRSCACAAACSRAQGRTMDRPQHSTLCLLAPPPPPDAGAAALDAYLQSEQGWPNRADLGQLKPWEVVPGAMCSQACSGRGVCRIDGGRPPACHCAPDFEGNACERKRQNAPPCLNDCSSRGVCSNHTAWCACQPGFWGLDCALSMDASGAVRLRGQQGTANATAAAPNATAAAQCGPYAAFMRSIHEDLLPWADGITEQEMDAALQHTLQTTGGHQLGLGFLLRGGKLFVINGSRTDFAMVPGKAVPLIGGVKHMVTYVRALLQLADTDGAQLPDVEFVVEQSDVGNLDLSKPSAPEAWREQRRGAPLMRYCKSDDSPEILIPYHHVYERQITAQLIDAEDKPPWAQRKDVLFGYHHGYNRAAGTPTTTRMGADGMALPDWARASTRIYLRNFSEWAGAAWANSSSLEIMKGPRPMNEWRQYKYLLHIDGISCTSKLEQMLPLGSLIFKEESGYRGFFHRLLVPFEHYVPYWRHRPQELLDGLVWARAHDAEAAAIGVASQALARKFLHKEGIRCYWILLLTELGRLQRGFKPGARMAPQTLVPAEEYLAWARAADNGTNVFGTAEKLELV